MADRTPVIGYHASHEQFDPGELLRLVQLAETAGFDAAMCSDHLQPWSERQGQSGFAWAWLGAALQATSLSFGTVNAPGQRYHPAVVAQALATLATMFPDRVWVALGSGEALNESVTGDPWPPKDRRNRRLLESAMVIRALLEGRTVTHRGLVTVEEARLWTRPETPPPVLGAALTAETARWVASWADGLITVARPPEQLRPIVDAFREGGGEGKPMWLQVHLAFGPDDAHARASAYDQWRTNVFDSPVLADLRSPSAFDAAARFVRPEDLESAVRISASTARHVDWLCADLELGFDRLYLHEVGRDQAGFIETFGREVLPQVRGRGR